LLTEWHADLVFSAVQLRREGCSSEAAKNFHMAK
jgi:hypothetical protein